MSTKKTAIRLTLVALLAFMALVTGIFMSHYINLKKKIDLSQFHGTVLEQARDIHPFNLTGIDNKPFTNKNLQGQWTFIFFGFTDCGYVCPTTMAELAKMYRLLEDQQLQHLPQVLMVSIDPERDGIEKLTHYVRAFHPNFLSARGNGQDIKKMTNEMGIAYAKIASTNEKIVSNYDIQHSGAILLFNPNGQLKAFFTSPHAAALLAKDYQMLVASGIAY